MDHGKIIEQGTYAVNAWAGTGMIWLKIFLLQKLMAVSAVFSRLIEEHGNAHSKKQNPPTGKPIDSLGGWKAATDAVDDVLMQEEERNTGAVAWDIYKKYLENAGGIIWAPVIGALLLMVEGNNGGVFYCADLLSQLMLNSRHYALSGILEREYDLPLRSGGLHGGLRQPW
jgi:hypothetical protein